MSKRDLSLTAYLKNFLNLIVETIKAVQKDIKETKMIMRKFGMRVEQLARNEGLAMFLYMYKGYGEQQNYFNLRIKNKVSELLEFYLYVRFI